jgi:hypothetical protein
MLTRTTIALAVCVAALCALPTAAQAQTTNPVMDRFTFTVPNAEKAGPSGTARMDLVITQWSSEADRNRVFAALEEGTDKLADAIWGSPLAGYIYWPGNLEYSIRYAYKTARPDGGEDLVLVTDRPVSFFWDEKAPRPQVYGYNVIQVHIDKNGRGEGKLGTKISPNKTAKTFMLDSNAGQSALLTDVRRERTAND